MNIRRISTSSLLDFLAIASSGSINRAARQLNISQSALTRSLKRLEENLGVELIQRRASGVAVTPFGEVLLAHGRTIESELRQAIQEMQDLTETSVTSLVIGMSPTCAHRLVPMAVSRLMRQRPKLTVRLVEAGKPMLMADLTADAIDMFIAMKNPSEVLPGIAITDLFRDEFGLLVRTGHPLAGMSQPISPKMLAGYAWVMPDVGGILRVRFDEWLRRDGVAIPKNVISTASISATKALVLSSDRIAAGPIHAFEKDLRDGTLVKLGGTWSAMMREFSLYRKAEAEESPIVVLFVAMLRELLKEIPSLQPIATS